MIKKTFLVRTVPAHSFPSRFLTGNMNEEEFSFLTKSPIMLCNCVLNLLIIIFLVFFNGFLQRLRAERNFVFLFPLDTSVAVKPKWF